jgi:hypothetical protein
MYKGFELNSGFFNKMKLRCNISSFYSNELREYGKLGSQIVDSFDYKKDRFIREDGTIDASRMQRTWFPLTDADIFISHSHKDKRFAIALAGLIRKRTGLKPFVDSCVWGYAKKLLRDIDNEFCRNSGGKTYDYKSHNFAANHIYTMLTTALDMMIYKTECFFFLNTSNSIQSSCINDPETESPWLYHELIMSKLLYNPPKRSYEQTKLFDGGLPSFRYSADTDHLKTLCYSDFNYWINRSFMQGYSSYNRERCLDVLFRIHDM